MSMTNIAVGHSVKVFAYGKEWLATVTHVEPNWGESKRALNIYVTSPDGQGRGFTDMVRYTDKAWRTYRTGSVVLEIA